MLTLWRPYHIYLRNIYFKFQWNDKEEQYFQNMNQIMSSIPALTIHDFFRLFIIECDAFGFGIDVVLVEDGYPIVFGSRKLNVREHRRSTYDKEMLAVMRSLGKWKVKDYANFWKEYQRIDHIFTR